MAWAENYIQVTNILNYKWTDKRMDSLNYRVALLSKMYLLLAEEMTISGYLLNKSIVTPFVHPKPSWKHKYIYLTKYYLEGNKLSTRSWWVLQVWYKALGYIFMFPTYCILFLGEYSQVARNILKLKISVGITMVKKHNWLSCFILKDNV